MAELGRNIFWALITEILMIGIAIVLKDDKKKVVVVLSLGTLVAGIIGFRQPLSLFIRGFSPSVPNISFPTRQPVTEASSQTDVVQKLETIYSFKTRGFANATMEDGNIIRWQVESEYVRPDRLHRIERSDDGQFSESINVGDKSCVRQSQSEEWYCGDGFISDEIDRWTEIVMGQVPFGLDTIIVVDSGARTKTWNGEECVLYYESVTFTDDPSEETYGLCFDVATLFPVKYEFDAKWPNNPGTKAIMIEFSVFDINEPIDISLPTP